MEVRGEQLRNPSYWDLTTYFLDNEKKGVPTEAFRNGRTYRPAALEEGYELSEQGLDWFVRELAKRVARTEKWEAKERRGSGWESMET